ncbi:MAG: hypothetical protein LQ341_007100 [Variospora aurantia]|nr:MAG: hypothetical protein LQ341_007100 [Variospora aurantia]
MHGPLSAQDRIQIVGGTDAPVQVRIRVQDGLQMSPSSSVGAVYLYWELGFPTAPAGAARLNTTKCALAPLFPNPCFSNTLVNPNAAGALCIMIARKMIKPREELPPEECDAPSAMPSAAAWMTRPRVVEKERCDEGVWWAD